MASPDEMGRAGEWEGGQDFLSLDSALTPSGSLGLRDVFHPLGLCFLTSKVKERLALSLL